MPDSEKSQVCRQSCDTKPSGTCQADVARLEGNEGGWDADVVRERPLVGLSLQS